MKIDWSTLAAWVGAIGGLSGFASLAATAWWRRQDQQRVETDRLSVQRVSRGAYGLTFWVKYAEATPSEGLKVKIEILGGGRGGPFVEACVRKPYNPATGSSELELPSQRLHLVETGLGNWTGDPQGVHAAWLLLHGSPPPKKAKVRITVFGDASGQKLTSKTLHVAP